MMSEQKKAKEFAQGLVCGVLFSTLAVMVVAIMLA